MKKRMLFLVLLPLLCGCSLLKLPSIPSPENPKTLYSWKETVVRKPQTVVVGKKAVVVEEVTKEIIVNYEKLTPKKTFIQTVGSWVSGLGITGIILLVIGLFVAPLTTIGFLKSRLEKWKEAMKETVSALKEADATDNATIRAALAEKQSISTKKIVDSIKRTL